MKLEDIFSRATKAVETSKTLTTKDRKALKSSTFCGPGRSFPVPDCKHVAVAKTYLARAKFSESTKKSIAACINRKAKQLGCNTTTKAKACNEEASFKFIELSYDEKQLYASEIFEETKRLVEESIKSPGMDLDFSSMEEGSSCPNIDLE